MSETMVLPNDILFEISQYEEVFLQIYSAIPAVFRRYSANMLERMLVVADYRDGQWSAKKAGRSYVLSRAEIANINVILHGNVLSCQAWLFKGRLHNFADRPATKIIQWGGVTITCWYKHGKLHREGGPARIECEGGEIVESTWYRRGRRQSEGYLAAHSIYIHGILSCEFWYRQDELHREGAPAMVKYEWNRISMERWYLRGRIHRADGPAITHYMDGGEQIKNWYCLGRLHRSDGPAIVHVDKCGKVLRSEWYIDGLYSPEPWWMKK